ADGPPALRERQGESAINPLETRGERVDEAERQRSRLAPHDALDSAGDHVEHPAGGYRSIRLAEGEVVLGDHALIAAAELDHRDSPVRATPVDHDDAAPLIAPRLLDKGRQHLER